MESLTCRELLDLFPLPPSKDQHPSMQSISNNNNNNTLSGNSLAEAEPAQSSVAVAEPKKPQNKLTSMLKNSFMQLAASSQKTSLSSMFNNTAPASAHSSSRELQPADDDRLKLVVPSHLPQDIDYVELMKRACIIYNSLSMEECENLMRLLHWLPPSRFAEFQSGVQECIQKQNLAAAARSSTGNLKSGYCSNLLNVSKNVVDFTLKNKQPQLNVQLRDLFCIDLKAGKCNYNIIVPKSSDDSYSISVDPEVQSGKLRAKDDDQIEIRIYCTLKRNVLIEEMLVIEMQESHSHFIPIHVNARRTIFGAPFSELSFTSDSIYPAREHRIPSILKFLKDIFASNDGMDAEEIFRKHPDDEKLFISRVQLERHLSSADTTENLTTDNLDMTYLKGNDVTANLIKIFFREMPTRLFQASIADVAMCETEEEALQIYSTAVSEEHKSSAEWLLDFMNMYAQNHEKNLTSAKKLAIVMAPNLFPANEGALQKNADYLRKQSDVLTLLLENHINTKLKISP